MQQIFGIKCETPIQKMGQELALRMDGMFPFYRHALCEAEGDHKIVNSLNNSGFGADIRAHYGIWGWTDEAHFVSWLVIADLVRRIT